jgi:acyl dehydratase
VDPVRAAQGPFGATVAHGFLTLSLIPHFFSTAYTVQAASMGVNYGLNKVRFMAPVRVHSRLRALLHLQAVEKIAGDALQLTWQVSVACEGQEKPVCVAQYLVRRYPPTPN